MNPTAVTAARPNDHARYMASLARINNAFTAINSLLRQGYIVQAMHIDALTAKPVIELVPEPRLARMVERDQACYYMRGRDHDGKFRMGQFDRAGCAVIWRERADWGRA